MSEINCTVSNSNALTVGSVFELHCPSSPEVWTGIDPEQAQLKLAAADQYKLKLLKLDFPSKNEAVLTVTSYKPGSHNLAGLQIIGTDAGGNHVVTLAPVQFAVVSVMDPQKPQEQPYGALGPVKLSLPSWYWLVIAGVIAFFAGIVWYRIWKRSKKKKLLAKMHLFETAQTPYFQFHHAVRKIQRDVGFVTDAGSTEVMTSAVQQLSQAYKIYLARTFLIPTLDWGEKRVLSDLKKNYRSIYEEHRSGFKKSLAELSRAQKALSQKDAMQLSLKDIEQTLKMVRDHVDQVEPMVLQQKTKKIFGGFG